MASQKCDAPLQRAGHRAKAIISFLRHMGVTRAGNSCRLGLKFVVSVIDMAALQSKQTSIGSLFRSGLASTIVWLQ